jgi:N-formylglutamate amidohydrolase
MDPQMTEGARDAVDPKSRGGFTVSPALIAPGPFVFASPHSGQACPTDFGARADIPPQSLHSTEDALVDRLIACGPAHGAAVIAGQFGRAYLDLNRDPAELDPRLIADAPEGPLSAKVAAGFGILPRLGGDGQPLYDRRLPLQEARDRIARVHTPYHAALSELMQAAFARHGHAVLIDWHSMPARINGGVTGPDVVLGDRYGTSCATGLTRRLRTAFEQLGWRVALNQPYPGGYSTRIWGRPTDGFDAIQIELNRGLYFDEEARQPGPGWSRCAGGLRRVIAGLCDATT